MAPRSIAPSCTDWSAGFRRTTPSPTSGAGGPPGRSPLDPEDRPALALLPVRLETRVVAGGTRLLVRVHPDVVHVDAFEPELTAAEIAWGEHFWKQTWLAAR